MVARKLQPHGDFPTFRAHAGMTRAQRAGIVVQWVALASLVGVLCGVASAVFLRLLDGATQFRAAHEVMVYTLPLAGLLIGLVYERIGTSMKGGSSLIIDTIHNDLAQLPVRMAPLVLVGTVLTHLFGGSAGREGTAVQMGASLADEIAHRFGASRDLRRALLAAGIAGGFGSVFGTPIAGVVFALEVVGLRRIDYRALLPALGAALIGDRVTRALGVVHTAYPVPPTMALSPALIGKLLLIGAAMALAAATFVASTHALKGQFERRIPRLPMRMFVGGMVVVFLWKLVGSSDYLGLGVPTIVRAFSDPKLLVYAFAAKLLFTTVTLAAGYLGGEVTPLFFVGATLGSVLAHALGLPLALGAAVGLGAVFGAAAKAPLALSIMVVELLGAALLPHVAVVTGVAHLLSGRRGLYRHRAH